MDLKDLPPSERSKIATLLNKDKKQDDISWMYNQPQVDKEAFLLGKEVTSIGEIEKLGQDYEESPAQRLARIDMEAKFREDPLTVMKQRETEKRIELLRNTAKVKKLRRLLTMQKHHREKKRKRKHLEKKRKSSRSRSSSSSSDSSSGDELLDKFIKIVRQSDELDGTKSRGEEHSKHKGSSSRHDKSSKTVDKDQPPSTSHHDHSLSEHKRLSREKIDSIPQRSGTSEKNKYSSSSHSDCSRVVEEKKLSFEEHEKRHERRPDFSGKEKYQKSIPHSDRSRIPEGKKLSREELEARRVQMMIDAKEHEKHRVARASHHYQQKKEQEAREAEARSRHGASFITDIKNDHAQRSTIEEGVHRKASSRQRGELSSNFLRR